MQVSDLIERWNSAEGAGFDLSPSRSLEVANQAIKRFARKSRSIKGHVDLGPTVADQAQYALEDRVLDLRAVLVGGARYGRASEEEYFDLVSGDAAGTYPYPGAFAPSFDDDAGSFVALWPTPTEADIEILGLAVLSPADVTADSQIPYQDDAVDALLHEMTAIGYETIDENPQMASYHHDLHDADAQEIGDHKRSRIGSGPFRIGFLGRR